MATEAEARAAYEQFAYEPHPMGFGETWEPWEVVGAEDKALWHRVATAVLNATEETEREFTAHDNQWSCGD